MNTEKINILSENEGNDKSEDKSKKGKTGKKMVGKTAQFAGAAGVGAAATVAASAMDTHEEIETASVNEAATESESLHQDQDVETVVEEPVEFDPNDIMIEENEESVADLDESDLEIETVSDEEQISSEELQPITSEDEVVSPEEIELDDIVEPDSDPTEMAIEELPGDFNFEMEEDLINDTIVGFVDMTGDSVDNEDVLSDPDILGDILNV